MPNLTQLRLAAREIFDEALRAVDPAPVLHQSVGLNGRSLRIGDETFDLGERPVYSIAIGKAAFKLAWALENELGDSFKRGVISAPPPAGPERLDSSRWQIFHGGHPLPDETSLLAATESFELLKQGKEDRALIVFLVSGGGSAMLEWPLTQEISLQDLRTANQALVGCGGSIAEVNAVRRTFSAVKGGRLAERAPDCDQLTLIVSDVPSGEERDVASGPSLAPPEQGPDPLEVVECYGLGARLPEAILRTIRKTPAPAESALRFARRHLVLLDNRSALAAAAKAARRRGFRTEVAEEISDQPIEDGCAQLLSRFAGLQTTAGPENRVCLIAGGEFACPVKGVGLGGRNLETALRLVTAQSSSIAASWVAILAGTDGIDGNSPAAGAIIDSTTIDRARAIGLEPAAFLERSDAYSFFVALGDVLATGPTGTNVRDIRIVLGGSG